MKHAILSAALGLSILAGATLSHAQDDAAGYHGGDRGMMFERIDTDGDGKVTKAEMSAHRAARLARFDTDQDGFLSAEELRAGMAGQAEARIERRVSRMMEHHDADGDGLIATDELTARHSGRMFDRADTDGDGALSPEEFEAMHAGRHGKG